MKIIITESAADDLAEGYTFYEAQCEGLGNYFESSILTDIRSLVIYSGIHEKHFGSYYRKITKHFPYAIYYMVDKDTIRIHAVLDTRRDPNWLRSRLP